MLVDSAKKATDVWLIGRFIDVRNGEDGSGSGFDGDLIVTAASRSVDHFCDGVANNPCTQVDIPFPIGMPCGTGKCLVVTSANVAVRGSVTPGDTANLENNRCRWISA